MNPGEAPFPQTDAAAARLVVFPVPRISVKVNAGAFLFRQVQQRACERY